MNGSRVELTYSSASGTVGRTVLTDSDGRFADRHASQKDVGSLEARATFGGDRLTAPSTVACRFTVKEPAP